MTSYAHVPERADVVITQNERHFGYVLQIFMVTYSLCLLSNYTMLVDIVTPADYRHIKTIGVICVRYYDSPYTCS